MIKAIAVTIILFLGSCVHTSNEPFATAAYKIGDCVMLIDKESGMKTSKDFLRIEDIQEVNTKHGPISFYILRWWLGPQRGWSITIKSLEEILQSKARKIYVTEVFESISKKAKCPEEEHPLTESN